jgi:hypothetical protein
MRAIEIFFTIGLLPQMTQAETAQCYMEYENEVYINGDCEFIIGERGSFDLNSGDWRVSISIDENKEARGYWNADGPTPDTPRYFPISHQQHWLGVLSREDACWVSKDTRICAW